MHDGSQVQGAGDGRDVAPVDDTGARIEHRCERCDRVFKYEGSYRKHVAFHEGITFEPQPKLTGIEGVDYIECRLCGQRARTLSKHLTQTHGTPKEAYLAQFPGSSLTSSMTAKRFKDRGQNFAWLKRAKERGDDLAEYKAKMSKAVSDAIMSNPKERARRAAQMAANNRTDSARKLSSNTAKKTSSRPEILEARSKRLARWRNENFDTFYEKCTKAMHSTWLSKPERILREIVQTLDSGFLGNQRLYDVNISGKSRRKQVDLFNRKTGIIIEFDGMYHFRPIKGQESLLNARKRDAELDLAAANQGLTLIRISYDQFTYKDGGRFSDACLQRLFELLKNPPPGVHYIGEAYNAQHEIASI